METITWTNAGHASVIGEAEKTAAELNGLDICGQWLYMHGPWPGAYARHMYFKSYIHVHVPSECSMRSTRTSSQGTRAAARQRAEC